MQELSHTACTDWLSCFQVLLNMRRRSTVGWSVQQVLLDCFGGITSIFQLLLEAIVLHDFSLVFGDPIKFLLGLVSIAYDVVLLVQHYYLYAVCRQSGQQPSVDKDTEDDESDQSRLV